MSRKWIFMAVPIVALFTAGLAYAVAPFGGAGEATPDEAESGFICPVTGEELPCSNCCPLNK